LGNLSADGADFRKEIKVSNPFSERIVYLCLPIFSCYQYGFNKSADEIVLKRQAQTITDESV
jgi:hypothetical protein